MAFKRQFFGTISSALTVISCGGCIGYSAILLPQLQEKAYIGNITNTDEAWIGSVISLSSIVGNLAAAPITEIYGRTTSHQILAVPMTIGWILIALSNSVSLLLLGRILTGAAMGMQVPISSMYVGELSSPKYRSFFLACLPSGIYIGSILSHLLGTFIDWRSTAYIFSTFSFASSILFFYIPDTPSWMVSREMFEEARTSFKWYREASETEELEIMIASKVSECLAYERKLTTQQEIFRNIRYLLYNMKQVEFVKPLIIIILLVTMIYFSGTAAYSVYGVQMINTIFKGGVNAYAVILSLDGVNIAVSIIACIALKYIKRRTALIVSSLVVSTSLILISLYMHLIEANVISSGLSYFALLMLFLNTIFLTLGILPLHWSLIGELFPLKTKSLGASISSIVSAFIFFLASITALDMFECFGLAGSYFFYGIVIIVITTILYFMLPETKDKTLQEIEDGFKSKGSKYFLISEDHINSVI